MQRRAVRWTDNDMLNVHFGICNVVCTVLLGEGIGKRPVRPLLSC